jgi:hypothetical protein
MSSNPPETTLDQAPSDFLHSLVDAMRRVVEATRDRTLAEMREAVETEAGQLDMSRTARENALRQHAEAEITGVGSWERAEIERIRTEALRKVQARGGQLDQELAELAAANTAEHAALAARADAYEREVADFIEGLEGIHDPAAFAAAARRMPSPWATKSLQAVAAPRTPAAPAATFTPAPTFAPATTVAPAESKPAEPAAVVEPVAAPMPEAFPVEAAPTEAPVAEAVAEPTETKPAAAPSMPEPSTPEPSAPEPAMAEPMAAAMPVAVSTNGTPAVEHNGVASATDAATADVVPAEPVAPEPVADQATSIQVHGLGSFGAITSFKQSLEKVDGIRSVTLGLGPSGEFIYTATHAPAFDLTRAIRAIEGDGVEIERDNGTLRVKVGKAARAG